MADIEDDTPMDAASGAAGGAASSGKRFEVKKWNAVSGVCMLCALLPAGLCAFARSFAACQWRTHYGVLPPCARHGGFVASLTPGSLPFRVNVRAPAAGGACTLRVLESVLEFSRDFCCTEGSADEGACASVRPSPGRGVCTS